MSKRSSLRQSGRSWASGLWLHRVALLACVIIGLGLGLAGSAQALPDSTWVVAVGNNRGDASDLQLLYAERDARELADVLRTQGGVASDRVRLLLDESADTLRRTLITISASLRAGPGDGVADAPTATALVVYYSGHADAEALHMRGSRLSFDELRALVSGSPATMRILVVDACRSGSVTRVKGVAPAPEFSLRLDNRVEAEGTAMISSSTAGESSQESDRLRGSFFSHHLVNALRGAADRNGDGRVTLSEAYAYTYTQTLRSSGQTLSLQHPTYAYQVKGSGDLVLTTPGQSEVGATRLRLAGAGQYLIAEERESGAVVAELVTSRDQATLALPRGRYFVQRRGSDEYREYQVTLRQGEQEDLARLPYRAIRYDQLVRKRGGVRRSVHGLGAILGIRGEPEPGLGPSPTLSVSYSADLPWLTLGTRLRGSTIRVQSVDLGLVSQRFELGLALLLQRYVDTPWFSAAFGLAIEATYLGQRFAASPRLVADRSALGLGIEALFSLERRLVHGLGLRLEGGPVAQLGRRAVVQDGVEVGAESAAHVTGYVGGGLLWRL